MQHYNIIVSGKVQGVYYRANAQQKANEFQIRGYVKNLPNGDVYIEAEGEEEMLQKLVDWCYIGPLKAKVRDVKIEQGKVMNYSNFEVRY